MPFAFVKFQGFLIFLLSLNKLSDPADLNKETSSGLSLISEFTNFQV